MHTRADFANALHGRRAPGVWVPHKSRIVLLFRRSRPNLTPVDRTPVFSKPYRARNIVLLLTSSLTIMSAATIAPSLPQMAEVFARVPRAEFLSKLLLTLPTLFIALAAPFAGSFADRNGRIKILLAAMVVYALAGASGFLLNNLYHILAGRVLLGLAIGVIMTISITLVGDYFLDRDRQRYIGIQGAFVSFGGVVFIGVGGFLADVSWRAPFLVYLLALALFPFARKFLGEPVRHGEHGSPSATSGPGRGVRGLFVTAFVIWVLFFMIPVQIPFYVKQLGIGKNSYIGLAIAVNTASAALASLFYDRLKRRMTFPTIYVAGFLCMAVAYLWIAVTSSYGQMLLALVCSGAGMGLILPNTTLWVIHRAAPEWRGRITGRLTSWRFSGQFISPIAAQPVVGALGLHAAFGLAAGLLLILAVVFWFQVPGGKPGS